MCNYENLREKMILVGMDDADITTSEKTIIGANSLATCTGVLLYNEDRKTAIVAHVSSNPYPALNKVFNIIVKNGLNGVNFKYKIILGYDDRAAIYYDIIGILKDHFKDFTPFDDNNIPYNAVYRDDVYGATCFAFDAKTGTFVTDKIFLDGEINNIKYR